MKKLKIIIHQPHHTIGDFIGIEDYLKSVTDKISQDDQQNPLDFIHLFPELFLTGYPLQDLCLQKSFIVEYHKFLKQIENHFKSLSTQYSNHLFLMGAPHYFNYSEKEHHPLCIKNSLLMATPGEAPKFIYDKMLLPSYDIFDETKYFTPGKEPKILTWNGFHLALQICEDMWSSNFYSIDPVKELKKLVEKGNVSLDLIINLSASPFAVGKNPLRINRAKEISQILEAPFVYVNRVGGEDEVLFDGGSFLVNGQETLLELASFKEDLKEIEVPSFVKGEVTAKSTLSQFYDGEEFLRPRWSAKKGLRPTLSELTDQEAEEILKALIFGFQEYAKKCSFKSFLVALSGGIDSALVLTIIRLGLQKDQSLEAIYMPSKFSSKESYDLSKRLVENLKIPLHYLPIKFLHSSTQNLFKDTFKFPLEGLADENIQSRMRGMLLYAYSNAKNQMVLNTSNKSELSVGYSTLYGDSVGALSLLGDLYKSEIFKLAQYINKKYNALIPEEIITRPPTAELRENQKDQDSLPPYDELDVVLEGILSYRMNKKDLVSLGFDEARVGRIMKLVHLAEYKRKQFCPIVKLRAKSFGFGYRVPITKTFHQ